MLPFGLSSAPRVFSKILGVLMRHWRSQDIRRLAFLDDWFFICRSPADCGALLERLHADCARAHFQNQLAQEPDNTHVAASPPGLPGGYLGRHLWLPRGPLGRTPGRPGVPGGGPQRTGPPGGPSLWAGHLQEPRDERRLAPSSRATCSAPSTHTSAGGATPPPSRAARTTPPYGVAPPQAVPHTTHLRVYRRMCLLPACHATRRARVDNHNLRYIVGRGVHAPAAVRCGADGLDGQLPPVVRLRLVRVRHLVRGPAATSVAVAGLGAPCRPLPAAAVE